MCKLSIHWRSGCWVKAYYRKDGTWIPKHWRDGTTVNDHCILN